MASFPELHGESQIGKTKLWSIKVTERNGYGVIETTHGYIDGKKQINEKIITEGKNIAKKNETTPLQQAINEARSAWIKKKETGYTPVGVYDTNPDNTVNDSKNNTFDEDVPSPMLAHDYNKRGKSIQYPCYVQRKYDGTRCIAVPGKGLFSRNKKQYPHMLHIINEINKLPPAIILDGELYSDILTFQEIVGIVKRNSLKDGDDTKQLAIQLHVYDIINDTPYEERYANLQLLFNRYKFKYLKLVKSELCINEDTMKELHSKYVAEGFEGIMLRNTMGSYSNTRSIHLQKYKEFFDAEYEIVDYKDGDGLEEGCVIWVCKTNDGKLFNCRPRGSREQRIDLFNNGSHYIGRMITIRYQEMTDSNIPRFPVGISFRDEYE